MGLFLNPQSFMGYRPRATSSYSSCCLCFWGSHRNSKESLKNSRLLHFKATLFTSLSICVFYLLLGIYVLFVSRAMVAVEADLAVRAIAWLTICLYLHLGRRFLPVLRIWWALFLMVCAAFVVADFVWSRGVGIMETHLWVLDLGSILGGLILCCVGWRVVEEATPLREPLLNAQSSEVSNTTSIFANVGFLSLLTFSWMGPLLSVGHKRTLDLKDVPQLAPSNSVNGVYPIFQRKLEAYIENDGHGITPFKLAKALVASTWQQVASTAFLALIYTFALYVGPYSINFFVQYLNGYRKFANEGYLLVLAFIVAKFFECFSQRHWFFRLQQVGIRVRSSLVAMIYQKGLTLSSQARQGRAIGEIINIMSVDAHRVDIFSWYMHEIWIVPVQVTLALLILYSTLGLASLAALAATIIVMIANIPLGKMQEEYQEKMMECKDTRMKATSEILRNMRILKLQGWEMKFLDKIMHLRQNESNWLKKYVYMSAMSTFVFWGAPTFVAVATFGACILLGIPLESGKVLSALATFRVLQESIYNLPDTVSMIVQTKVSLERISVFLSLKDLESNMVQKLPRGSSEVAIEVSNGNFSWDQSSETPTLKELNFQVLHGMSVAVCGTVGSGKTSLLSCILGEIPKISGIVNVCGSTAFVAQTPWIQSGKIQENILFGKEMDTEKYELVLEACSLKKDLEILPFKDQTVIGERGINLSGGQKQRIQIARALYNDADIFLFDDPFSAVDAHTGSHLFKECLLGILASKTVIYVTHQVEFLPSADLILVMREGNITQAGKYADILNSGTDFMELVGAHKDALAELDSTKLANGSSNNVVENGLHDSGSSSLVLREDKKDAQNGEVDERVEQKAQLVKEEEREKGKVDFWVYWRYLTMTFGGALVPLILLVAILFQVLQIGGNYWMSWASPASKDIVPPVSGPVLIYVFVALALASSVCILVRTLLVATAGYKTATLLFNKMHTCIFRAPMSFFDSTPSGRILNRASTDQSDIDTTIPYQIASLAVSVIQLLGIIVVMSQVSWQVFIIFIPVIAVCIWYQQYYIDTSRELARLVGVCKAPIIQHFAESLLGTMTIRSFDQEWRFVGSNFHLSDEYSRPKFYNAGAMEWLCFRLDMLSIITFTFSLVFLLSLPKGVIHPGLAGLAVTYGLNLNVLQADVVRNLCNLDNEIISVERILQYMSIPGEPPLTVETKQPDSSNWPSMGEVGLHDVQVRYAPHMPFVLRGLTCTFPGGKKTGIVGRTGSGKSTLIQALFRIVDPTVGRILIDGIDISTIGLHDLRFRLSIIPQEPAMFEGTVRNNLDPLKEYTDGQIWEALDCCQLGDEVRKKELKLDSSVTENGDNWSVGQRQLVCLGRIILKRSKVLVLDEATASVDTATDSLIQKTLQQQFSDSTVITVAHRITSVIDSDMVLLLDNGLIVQHDTPTRLLESRSSLFSKLVSEYTVRSSSNF